MGRRRLYCAALRARRTKRLDQRHEIARDQDETPRRFGPRPRQGPRRIGPRPRRDAETFWAKTETRPKTYWSETETRCRDVLGQDRDKARDVLVRDRDVEHVVRDETLLDLETVSRQPRPRDRDHIPVSRFSRTPTCDRQTQTQAHG